MSALDFFWLLVFAPLIFLSVALSRRLFGHWFTPLSIYVGINSLSMSAYHLRLLEMGTTVVSSPPLCSGLPSPNSSRTRARILSSSPWGTGGLDILKILSKPSSSLHFVQEDTWVRTPSESEGLREPAASSGRRSL